MTNHKMRSRLLATAAFASGVSIVGAASAQVVDYPNGSTNVAPIVLSSDTVQLRVSTGSATQAGSISEVGGAHLFEKIGAGTLRLTGANTNTGGVNITSGTLQIGAGGATGSITGPVTIASGGILSFNRSDAATFAGSISGGGLLRQVGSGTLVLTGAATHSGGTQVLAGTLSIGAGGTSGSVLGNIDASAGSQVVFNRSDNFTYAGNLRALNAAGIEKGGAGTLTITGEIRAGSGFVVSEGTLGIGDGGDSGTVRDGRVVVAAGAHVIADHSVSYAQFTGVTGAGSFTKNGSGTLTVTNVIDNTGGVTVNAGVLRIGSAGGTSGSFGRLNTDATVGAGAVVAFAGDSESSPNATYAYGLSGGGVLRKEFVGTLFLTGANTNTGGLDIQGGTVQVGAGGTTGSITGPVTLGNGALLAFNRSNTVTFSGSVSGSGYLRQLGSGTLVLTGAANPTLGTWVRAGTLSIGAGGTSGSVAGDILNDAAVVFDRSDATTYAGRMSGTGSLTKQGAGVLTLTGINAYSGGTTVSAGVLNITGSIANSAVTVAGGATLTGTGTVGSATIASGGTLAITGPTGVLNVAGGLTFAGGSTFSVNVTPGSAGRVNVSGGASLNGTLAATYAPGNYIARQYTVLSAQGGRTGSFSGLTNANLPTGFKADLSYDANNAYINLEILLPTYSGLSENQAGVANAIADYFNRTGGIDPIYALLTPDQLGIVAGESGMASVTTGARVAGEFLSAFSDQISDDLGRQRAGEAGEGWKLWGRLDGSSSTIGADEDAGYSETGITHQQILLGADRVLTANLAVGAAYASGTAEFDDERGGRGEADFGDLGLYGRLNSQNAYVGIAASFGSMESVITRTVQTDVTDVLRSTVESDTFGARLEAGARMRFAAVDVRPYLSAQTITVDVPAYSETVVSGAGTYALSYAATDVTHRRFELGGRFETLLRQIGAGSARISFLLAAVYEEADSALTANFTALPGSTFASHGAIADGGSVLVGAGISAEVRPGLSLGGTVRAQFGALDAAGAQLSLRYAW